MAFTTADSYGFEGQNIAGSVLLPNGRGDPQTGLTVDGTEVEPLSVTSDDTGIQISGVVDAIPDLHTVEVVVSLPKVNLDSRSGSFAGFAVLVTKRTSIGGPRLVQGSLENYQIRPLSGQATLSFARGEESEL